MESTPRAGRSRRAGLRVDSTDGKLRAALFGYACHNTSYECRGLYTTQGFFAPAAQDTLITKVPELAERAGRKVPE